MLQDTRLMSHISNVIIDHTATIFAASYRRTPPQVLMIITVVTARAKHSPTVSNNSLHCTTMPSPSFLHDGPHNELCTFVPTQHPMFLLLLLHNTSLGTNCSEMHFTGVTKTRHCVEFLWMKFTCMSYVQHEMHFRYKIFMIKYHLFIPFFEKSWLLQCRQFFQ